MLIGKLSGTKTKNVSVNGHGSEGSAITIFSTTFVSLLITALFMIRYELDPYFSIGLISYYDVAVVEYVTASVSPAVTVLETAKLPSEYNVPAVEL